MPATMHDTENHAQISKQPSRKGTTLNYRNIISLKYRPSYLKTKKQSSTKVEHRFNITLELILSISEL